MGAEFIGAIVRIKNNREEAFKALAHTPDDDIKDILNDILGDWDDLNEYLPRDAAAEYLKSVYDAFDGNRRDGAVWKLDDKWYLVTGGMSWGDAPTELCEAIWVVGALGVTA